MVPVKRNAPRRADFPLPTNITFFLETSPLPTDHSHLVALGAFS